MAEETKENNKTTAIVNKTGNAFGIASFIFGIIGAVKKQLVWSILGLVCAIVGFIISPILLGIFGLASVRALLVTEPHNKSFDSIRQENTMKKFIRKNQNGSRFMLRTLVAIFILLSFNLAYSGELKQEIPERFLGKWSPDLNSCDTPFAKNNVTIETNSLDFYESSGTPVAVVTQGDLEVMIILNMSGEGQQWITYKRFVLSEKGDTLTGGNKFVRYRCAK